jgi:hypothetical protein
MARAMGVWSTEGEVTKGAAEREDALTIRSLLVGVTLYVVLAMLLAWLTGYLSTLGASKVFFSTQDSIGYRRIGDYLGTLGEARRPNHAICGLRPFLFPLYVSFYRFVGIDVMQGLQVVLNGLTLCFLYASMVNLRAHRALALAATAVLAAMPSFHFLAYHALSETLTTVLIAASLYAASRAATAGPSFGSALGAAAVLITCSMLVKPALIPLATASLVVSIAILLRHDRRSLRWATLAVGALLLTQATYSTVLAKRPGISTAGRDNFERRFFTAVYGFAHNDKFSSYKSKLAVKAQKEYPSLSDKLEYVASQPSSTWKAFKYIFVHENLLEGSLFVKPKPVGPKPRHKAIAKFSTRLNVYCAYLHALALPFVLLFAAVMPSSRTKWIALGAYLGAASILLPTCLVYYQGDRTIIAAAPLWLFAYALVIPAALQWIVAVLKTKRALPLNP